MPRPGVIRIRPERGARRSRCLRELPEIQVEAGEHHVSLGRLRPELIESLRVLHGLPEARWGLVDVRQTQVGLAAERIKPDGVPKSCLGLAALVEIEQCDPELRWN